MTDEKPRASDYLKYAAAAAGGIIEGVQDRLGGLYLQRAVRADDIDAEMVRLDEARRVLFEAAGVFCAEIGDFDRYGDGRPVRSRLDFGNTHVEHVWHPYLMHDANQPHEVGTVATGRGSKQIVVTAPGQLDTVSDLADVDPVRAAWGDAP